jgi:hypothetical protein
VDKRSPCGQANEERVRFRHYGYINEVEVRFFWLLESCRTFLTLQFRTVVLEHDLARLLSNAPGARRLLVAVSSCSMLAAVGRVLYLRGGELRHVRVEGCVRGDLAGGLTLSPSSELRLSMRRLESLELHLCMRCERAASLAAALLRGAPRLRRLTLCRSSFSEQGWRRVMGALGCATSLTELRLDGLDGLEDEDEAAGDDRGGFAALGPALCALTSLTALRMQCPPTEASARALRPALRALARLQSLTLETTYERPRTRGQLRELLGAAHAPTVTELVLMHSELDAGCFESLGRLVGLRALDLSECSSAADPASRRAMARALGGLTRLTRLDVSFFPVGPDADGAAAFCQALARLTGLTALDVSRIEVAGAESGAPALCRALARLTSLTRLEMLGNELGAEGATALGPALARLTALARLDLSGNDLGPEGAAALGQALPQLTSLTRLAAAGNGFGHLATTALCPALARLTALAQLDLSGNGAGPHGVAAVAALLISHLTNLTSVDLGHNAAGQFGDGALAVLALLRPALQINCYL